MNTKSRRKENLDWRKKYEKKLLISSFISHDLVFQEPRKLRTSSDRSADIFGIATKVAFWRKTNISALFSAVKPTISCDAWRKRFFDNLTKLIISLYRSWKNNDLHPRNLITVKTCELWINFFSFLFFTRFSTRLFLVSSLPKGKLFVFSFTFCQRFAFFFSDFQISIFFPPLVFRLIFFISRSTAVAFVDVEKRKESSTVSQVGK